MYYTGPSTRLRDLYESITMQTQTAANQRSTHTLCQVLNANQEVLASGSYYPSTTGTVHLVPIVPMAKNP